MQLCVPGSLSLGRLDYKHKELRALINSFLHSALFTRRTLINWHHRLQQGQETLRVELSFTRWMSQHCPMWFRKPWTQGLISSLFSPLYELASCVRVSRTHSLMSNKLHKYIKKELYLWQKYLALVCTRKELIVELMSTHLNNTRFPLEKSCWVEEMGPWFAFVLCLPFLDNWFWNNYLLH